MRRPPQLGQNPRPLPREGDETIGTSPVTVEAREATGEPPTAQERPELLIDESGQSLAVAKARRLPQSVSR
ncbi:MAG: hypothetical protein ABL986_00645 [Vicinamibacterales bacterium]